jgi:hypothetical protein
MLNCHIFIKYFVNLFEKFSFYCGILHFNLKCLINFIINFRFIFNFILSLILIITLINYFNFSINHFIIIN